MSAVGVVVDAASSSWPLLIVDAGGTDVRVARLLKATPVDLLVMVCRHSVVELTATAEYLRELVYRDLVSPHQVVVVSQGPTDMWTKAVAQAMSACADVAAGAAALRLDFDRRFVDRSVPITGAGSDGARTVAACVSGAAI